MSHFGPKKFAIASKSLINRFEFCNAFPTKRDKPWLSQGLFMLSDTNLFAAAKNKKSPDARNAARLIFFKPSSWISGPNGVIPVSEKASGYWTRSLWNFLKDKLSLIFLKYHTAEFNFSVQCETRNLHFLLNAGKMYLPINSSEGDCVL